MRVWFLFLALILVEVQPAWTQTNSATPAQQIQQHEQKAHELLTQKKPQLAAKEFAAVLALDPQNLDAQGNLGVLLYFQNDYAGAEPHLRSAVEQKPDLVKIRALLGMCERHLGKVDLARTDLEAVFSQLQEPKVRLEAGLELIEIYTAKGELTEAARVVGILREGAPADPKILYAAYRIYTDLAAESLLDMSIAAPESGQLHQAMAHELNRAGDVAGAIKDFRAALAADPSLPGIQFELAEALHNSPDLKLKEEAVQEYKLAVAANPLDEKALTRLGDIAVEKGNLDEGEKYYKQTLAIVPNDVEAQVGLAMVYTQKGDPASALPLLEKAVATEPSNIMAHYRLSTVYRALHRPDDAKRELAEYKKYKDLKEKLRTIYKDMKVDTPQAPSDQ